MTFLDAVHSLLAFKRKDQTTWFFPCYRGGELAFPKGVPPADVMADDWETSETLQCKHKVSTQKRGGTKVFVCEHCDSELIPTGWSFK